MSWLARSIANSLKLDDGNEEEPDVASSGSDSRATDKTKSEQQATDEASSPISPSRGVREDFSELTKTLSKQFWGVASFLAPPPQSEPYKPIGDSEGNPLQGTDSDPDDVDPLAGLRSDFAEIGGRFRSGISKLSHNMAVSEITKMASNFLQLGSEEEDAGLGSGAIGVTDEVVAFVKDIATHPETWLDFPLPDNEDEEEFDMSDAQQEHALAVERLAPRLPALRIELCPGYMTEDSFWKIYFVLLHPRLSKQDAEILSTPQVVRARTLLAQNLHSRTMAKLEGDTNSDTLNQTESYSQHEESLTVPSTAPETSLLKEKESESATSTALNASGMDKQPIIIADTEEGKTVPGVHVGISKDGTVHSASSSIVVEENEDDDVDDWLKEESSEFHSVAKTTVPVENEEDVSFSDLEEDDADVPSSFKNVSYGSDKDSRDWVQLGKSSADSFKDNCSIDNEHVGTSKGNANSQDTKESTDWLDIDDIDVA